MAHGLAGLSSGAMSERFGVYGADGGDHWTLALIREWWRSPTGSGAIPAA